MKKLGILLALIFISSAVSFAEMRATIDPLDIGVGTRALGMARAYTAVADDANTLFLNPAGLAGVNNWGLTSTYSSVIANISNSTFGAYRSTNNEAFGIGYVATNITGDFYSGYRDPITNRIVPFPVVASGYNSSVLLLSYGVLLSKYFDFPQADRLSVGTSLKFFYQELKASDEAVATGHDLDIGVIYRAYDWLKLGFYGQNIVPASSGGLLVWNSGEEETIPEAFKFGSSMLLLGEKGLYSFSQDVFFNCDIEGGGSSARPNVWHLGLEWWPYKYFALRTGLDQDVYAKDSGNGVDNNLSFGLGLWYGDYGLDYAYHQYGPYYENITHYFSLSYGYPMPAESKPLIVAEKPKEVIEAGVKTEPAKDYLIFINPKNKAEIYTDSVNFNGEVLDPVVGRVEINSIEATIIEVISEKKVFNAMIRNIGLGRLPLNTACFDKDGKLLKEYHGSIIRLASFSDVPKGYWARDPIIQLATLGLFGGYPDGTFKPGKVINRGELTTLLVRALAFEAPAVTGDQFKDLKPTHWSAKYVKVGVDRGIVTGYRDQTFKPAKEITRAEGMIMIARFAGLNPPEVLREKPFPDIPESHWAAKMIYAAKSAGLLGYLDGKNFDPNRPLTRAEAAEILSQTQFAKSKVAQLYN